MALVICALDLCSFAVGFFSFVVEMFRLSLGSLSLASATFEFRLGPWLFLVGWFAVGMVSFAASVFILALSSFNLALATVGFRLGPDYFWFEFEQHCFGPDHFCFGRARLGLGPD